MSRRPLPAPRVTLREKAPLAVEILLVYIGTRWRMRRIDLRRMVADIHAQLEPPAARTLSGQDTWEVALHLGFIVDRMLRLMPTDSRCLVQSLVLSRLLAARGIPSTFVIGAHSRPSFAAHAWVECEGRPVLPVRGFGASRLLELSGEPAQNSSIVPRRRLS